MRMEHFDSSKTSGLGLVVEHFHYVEQPLKPNVSHNI